MQTKVGGTVSKTVKEVVQESIFPFTSVAIKVIGLTPKSAQVTGFGAPVNTKLAKPQASEVPLSKESAIIVAKPLEPRCITTVDGAQAIEGRIVSLTFTEAEQLSVLPLTSVTVSTTVLGLDITSPHLKVSCEIA